MSSGGDGSQGVMASVLAGVGLRGYCRVFYMLFMIKLHDITTLLGIFLTHVFQ